MGELGQKACIATQGSKDDKYLHLWSMLFEENLGPVSFVVMLTQMCEGMKEKGALFFQRETLKTPSYIHQCTKTIQLILPISPQHHRPQGLKS